MLKNTQFSFSNICHALAHSLLPPSHSPTHRHAHACTHTHTHTHAHKRTTHTHTHVHTHKAPQMKNVVDGRFKAICKCSGTAVWRDRFSARIWMSKRRRHGVKREGESSRTFSWMRKGPASMLLSGERWDFENTVVWGRAKRACWNTDLKNFGQIDRCITGKNFVAQAGGLLPMETIQAFRTWPPGVGYWAFKSQRRP